MARQRKPTNLHLTLQRFAAPIVEDPQQHRSSWRDLMPSAREVRLDLGCGKGSFLKESALLEPDVLFVGMDYSPTCIARCAEKAVQSDLPNVRLIMADADQVTDLFAPGELDRIYLNFNAPFPKKKHAHLRLSHVERLMEYRTLLSSTGLLELRTDNVLYWRFSLEQLRIANYRALRQTTDLAAQPTWDQDREPVLTSEYFARTTQRGAHVYALLAQPGPAPDRWEQTAPLGLCEYLPQDLDQLDHIPYGMEDTVQNIRNRQKNQRLRQQAQSRADRLSQPDRPDRCSQSAKPAQPAQPITSERTTPPAQKERPHE
ncbi:MAG: tRNA (guanosine(46)-N7)-methyltransferase TrmB [Eggerthellales bacterium]|nr:tRNA (guanosine(46)-N7)-methyltransferase TrmB [Eggerthellales bacterium]